MFFTFLRLKRLDWLLVSGVAALAFCSLIEISSISKSLFYQQLIWFLVGFLILFLSSSIDWQIALNYKWIILGFYVVTVLLLFLTLFFAPTVRQTRSWLTVGSFGFQPSELAKVSLVIMLSVFFARRHVGIAHIGNLAASFVYFFVPAIIVFIQPDWGSALIFVGIWIGYLLVSGIRWRHLMIGILLFAVFVGASWMFLLKPYQRERIVGFLQPSYDPSGINYSVIQSKIAIGSAGIFGKGYGQGTQTQLRFLTEPATDFIFAAFVEEWGFLGGFVLVLVFLFVLLRIIKIGISAEDNFSRFLCLGAVILFLLEFLFNVGSNLGLLPVVGVTFPFLSYGGSSLLTKAFLVGIIQAIPARPRF